MEVKIGYKKRASKKDALLLTINQFKEWIKSSKLSFKTFKDDPNPTFFVRISFVWEKIPKNKNGENECLIEAQQFEVLSSWVSVLLLTTFHMRGNHWGVFWDI